MSVTRESLPRVAGIAMSRAAPACSGGPLPVCRADDQDRDLRLVAHLVDGGADEEVVEEAVAVGGHCDQVAVLRGGHLEDLAGRDAPARLRVDRQALAPEAAGDLVQVG